MTIQNSFGVRGVLKLGQSECMLEAKAEGLLEAPLRVGSPGAKSHSCRACCCAFPPGRHVGESGNPEQPRVGFRSLLRGCVA